MINDPDWIVRELRELQRAAAAPGPTMVASLAQRHGTQAALATASGISPARLAELNRGARPTKAERNALAWATAVRILGPGF